MKNAFCFVVGMLFICVLMPYLLTNVMPGISDSRIVQLWPLWLGLFAVGGYHANNIRSATLRAWVGTPIALPAFFICPIPLYGWLVSILHHV